MLGRYGPAPFVRQGGAGRAPVGPSCAELVQGILMEVVAELPHEFRDFVDLVVGVQAAWVR